MRDDEQGGLVGTLGSLQDLLDSTLYGEGFPLLAVQRPNPRFAPERVELLEAIAEAAASLDATNAWATLDWDAVPLRNALFKLAQWQAAQVVKEGAR